MNFTLTIDVNESDIAEAMEINNLTKEEAINRITNNFYMGLSCIDAMLHRDLGIECTESFVHKPSNSFDYNSHYPKAEDFPLTDIIMRANVEDLVWDEKLVRFARACWAECAIKHNITV